MWFVRRLSVMSPKRLRVRSEVEEYSVNNVDGQNCRGRRDRIKERKPRCSRLGERQEVES